MAWARTACWLAVSWVVAIWCSFEVVDGDVMNALFGTEAKRFVLGFAVFRSAVGNL
jgi:hypothetical protein